MKCMKEKKWLWGWIIICLMIIGCNDSNSGSQTVAKYDGGCLTLADLSAHREKMKKDTRFRKNPEKITPQFVFEHAVNMEMVIAKGLKQKLHLDPGIRTEIHYFMADLFLKIMQEKLVPEIDKDAIGIYGYSRDGKQATIAGAIDERIDVVLGAARASGEHCPIGWPANVTRPSPSSRPHACSRTGFTRGCGSSAVGSTACPWTGTCWWR